MKFKFFLFLLACYFSSSSMAQFILPTDDIKHIANINVGYDYNLISLDAGYAYYYSKYKTAVFANLTQGTALLGTGNYRTQIGLQTWQGSQKKLNLKTSLALVHTRSINKAGNYNGIGFSLQIQPGLNYKHIGFGADFQCNPFFSTHIKHSDFWRQYYYSDAKDGWYKLTTTNWRFGAYISLLMGNENSFELNFRGGYQTSGQYDRLIPGFYSIIGFNKKI
ncbi:MAG: hypothetical protein RL664_1725 [Bacteroidota bacterium]